MLHDPNYFKVPKKTVSTKETLSAPTNNTNMIRTLRTTNQDTSLELLINKDSHRKLKPHMHKNAQTKAENINQLIFFIENQELGGLRSSYGHRVKFL